MATVPINRMTQGLGTDLIFDIGVEPASLRDFYVDFFKNDELRLRKGWRDCNVSGDELIVPVTAEETILFAPGRAEVYIHGIYEGPVATFIPVGSTALYTSEDELFGVIGTEHLDFRSHVIVVQKSPYRLSRYMTEDMTS